MKTDFLTAKQNSLLNFAAIMHEGQVRKYTGGKYIFHPLQVAFVISHFALPNMVEVALCHDLLEDTPCTKEDLLKELLSIGYSADDAFEIADGVDDLSDKFTSESFPNLNRAKRKAKEVQRMSDANLSVGVATVKSVDIINNAHSIAQHDRKFAKVYLREVQELIPVLNRAGSLVDASLVIDLITNKT